MATVKAVLNKDRVKKHGEYPLVIQVIHKRKKRVVYTPYNLKVDEFDLLEQKAVYTDGLLRTRKLIKEICRFISMKKKEFERVIDQVAACSKNYTSEDIILKYRLNQSDKYLVTFMEHHVAEKEALGKMGTARAMRSTLRSLQLFMGNRIVEFSDIDYNFVKRYEEFLCKRNVKQNTVCFYLRNLRTVYNLAYENHIEMGEHNAFRKITIKTTKTVKRALKLETIEEICRLDLSETPNLDRARDLFMFSFYTRGMSFVDIIYLKHRDVIDDVICYKRRKTGQYMEVAITKPLQKLMDKYGTDKTYVLPFINEHDRPTLYQQYQAAYGALYRDLHQLQKILNLSAPLTTYVARHSWATIAKELGASTTIISEGLGHTSEKTTRIYLKDFDRSVIDLINEKIVSYIAV